MKERINDYVPKIGEGVPARQAGLPAHNPEPSTKRGKRRHEARNEQEKGVAVKAWATARTNRQSRYQKAMAGRSGHSNG
jgi:hypothetical protein